MILTSHHLERIVPAALFAGSLLCACQGPSMEPSAGINTVSAGAQAAPLEDGTEPAGTLSEDQIVGVLATANESEITHGHLVADKLTHEELRRYAGDMIVVHTQAQVRLSQIVTDQALTVDDSPIAQDLNSDDGAAASALENAPTGLSLDLKYAQAEADHQQKLLELIDNMLMPDAHNEALQAELQQSRTATIEHVQRVNDLAAQLTPEPPSPPRREY
jgi:predicted outer membrane protein